MDTEKVTSVLSKFVKGLKFKLETDGNKKAVIDLEIGATDNTPSGKLSVKLEDGQDPDIVAEIGEFEHKLKPKAGGLPSEYDGLRPLNEANE
ncbi:MAG: hypothetical protein KAS32_26290 [Candidatus Peribacteraceae bacterium]|nr:hypothetical protein [Candidatus Peribacteraceae bacterium]